VLISVSKLLPTSSDYVTAMPRLGVNIDHVATIRQARQTVEPDPVWAASLAELGGADGITIHLREDRRHIQDRDVRVLRDTVQVKLNLEMATAEEIVQIALQTKPQQVTLVPEKRQEITTEGGLDVIGNRQRVGEVVRQLQDAGIEVSLFIDPERDQIEASRELGVSAIELHTGCYADATSEAAQASELQKLKAAGRVAIDAGLLLHMGHGLTYRNVIPVAQIEGTCELNIGHSIIARAVLVGFEKAVREMKELVSC
jgi:pyridoxine 5-phosphate synthase